MSSQEKKKITRHTDLDVYQKSFAAAMKIFELSKSFPVEEKYSLTDQVRCSSRSVCANQAEAWRKRIYGAHFASKLNDCEAEAAETQTWIQFAVELPVSRIRLRTLQGIRLYHRHARLNEKSS
jgi:four helix bundle protein